LNELIKKKIIKILKKCQNMDSSKPNSPTFKKVFIQRDYSEGTGVKFMVKFPQELDGYVIQ